MDLVEVKPLFAVHVQTDGRKASEPQPDEEACAGNQTTAR